MSRPTDVVEFGEPPAVHVHPDHGLDVLLDRWRQAEGTLPVLARDDVRRVEGVITRSDVARLLRVTEAEDDDSTMPPG